MLDESLIDFARPSLSPYVWTRVGERYQLSDQAAKRILGVLKKCPVDLLKLAAEMRIVGSITTNLYVDDTDVDVHIVPKNPGEWSEEDVDELRKWFINKRSELGGFIGTHPIEIYIQTNPNQDLLSEGLYNVKTREWVKGPRILPEDYNPYEDFSDIAGEIRNSAEDADLLLGELKRDVIDYETIRSAIDRMSPEQKQNFLSTLQSKLEEIEHDIEELGEVMKNWSTIRKASSQPTSPEQALEDVEMAKNWRNKNAVFKFLSRYRYLKVISDLNGLLGEDDELDPKDVQSIKQIVGGSDVP